ncbi:MAG: protein-(glutamine-N5) methyltransferase, release factor-specific [Rhodobacterales bacterium]|nr:MAG: protein-(glutamine-N5) methyltransferase, release factor-specific [Rhodobacterales bacterium]
MGSRRLGGQPDPGRDARALLAHALGLAPDRLTLERERSLTAGELAAYETLLERRQAHEPVSRITGRRMFWGRNFKITPQVLDPRPETEVIVAAALNRPPPRTLLDLGTGSGILALTLLAEWPGARAVATDISPGALAVARANAAALGLAERLTLIEADWLAGVTGTFDLIVSNPPYIAGAEIAGLAPEVRDHDPRGALTPGGDGLDAYRTLVPAALAHLAPGGWLMVEIGPTQGPAVAGLFEAAGYAQVTRLPDLDGRARVVSGRRAAG